MSFILANEHRWLFIKGFRGHAAEYVSINKSGTFDLSLRPCKKQPRYYRPLEGRVLCQDSGVDNPYRVEDGKAIGPSFCKCETKTGIRQAFVDLLSRLLRTLGAESKPARPDSRERTKHTTQPPMSASLFVAQQKHVES
ncbi:hypothetical protein CRV24_005276 [Beauveria bassiana]|nr:hypothetical protein CRV24_005276 [Beauveria bassiana]